MMLSQNGFRLLAAAFLVGLGGVVVRAAPQQNLPPEQARETVARVEAVDPRVEIARQMGDVATGLRQGRVDVKILEQQRAILKTLEALIGTPDDLPGGPTTSGPVADRRPDRKVSTGRPDLQVKPDESGSTGGTSQVEKPGQPSRSGSPSGTGPAKVLDAQTGEPGSSREWVRAIWGQLPEAQRRRIPQRPGETFLPQYRTSIEAYYRELWESQSAQPKTRKP